MHKKNKLRLIPCHLCLLSFNEIVVVYIHTLNQMIYICIIMDCYSHCCLIMYNWLLLNSFPQWYLQKQKIYFCDTFISVLMRRLDFTTILLTQTCTYTKKKIFTKRDFSILLASASQCLCIRSRDQRELLQKIWDQSMEASILGLLLQILLFELLSLNFAYIFLECFFCMPM